MPSRPPLAAVLVALALWAAAALAASHPGIVGTGGAVASGDSYATEVGLLTLRRGGNAVDAAVATALALAVTHPEAGNLGGGGFAVVKLGDRLASLDFRETAPAAARREMYLDEAGEHYAERIFARSTREHAPPNFRPLEGRITGRATVEGCRGGGKNILELRIVADDERIVDARVSCGLCCLCCRARIYRFPSSPLKRCWPTTKGKTWLSGSWRWNGFAAPGSSDRWPEF